MMKSVALICVLLAVATDAKRDTAKISLLKDKVLNSAQQFSFDGFKDKPVGMFFTTSYLLHTIMHTYCFVRLVCYILSDIPIVF